MSILVKLAARHAMTNVVEEPFESISPEASSYYSLREQIQAAEFSMAKTQSSTTMGGIDYDTDDNDHR